MELNIANILSYIYIRMYTTILSVLGVISIFVAGFTIYVLKSKKTLKHIVEEIKYEIVYNYLGALSMLDDIVMKERNHTEMVMQSGKIALVTGGSRGIGVEVVKMLMQCDMHVIIGCRNVSAGQQLLLNIRKEGISTGDIKVLKLDTSSLESVNSFAMVVREMYPKIHVLINNAGIMFGPYVESTDGYESQFATNYLGHFLLTHLLLQNLKAAGEQSQKSRIVNVTSCAHLTGEINFDDINYKKQYITSAAYAQSKLAQILFSNYLNRQMKVANIPVQVYSVHPGIVNTNLFKETLFQRLFPWFMYLFFKTPKQGAIAIIHASISSLVEKKGGSYISNCEIVPPKATAYDVELQERLFDFTKKLLNIEDFGKVQFNNARA